MDAVPQAPLLGVAAWAPVGGFDGARHGCLTDPVAIELRIHLVPYWCHQPEKRPVEAPSSSGRLSGKRLV
jgi:hypothetical protein